MQFLKNSRNEAALNQSRKYMRNISKFLSCFYRHNWKMKKAVYLHIFGNLEFSFILLMPPF